MPTVRPTPKNYYYSGQGRLAMGDRNPTTGELHNMIFVGNVTSLSIDVEITKFDHKESMTGDRGLDLSLIQERGATFTLTTESLILSLLADGLFGVSASQTGATVTAEPHTATPGAAIPLKHPNVSSVVVTRVTGSTVLVEGTSYTVDNGFGTIYFPATGGVITSQEQVTVSYTYATYDRVEALTKTAPPERYLRFEGLNTVDGSGRLIEIPRASLNPLTGLDYINEELATGEMGGSILQDPLFGATAGTSKYFREKRMATLL